MSFVNKSTGAISLKIIILLLSVFSAILFFGSNNGSHLFAWGEKLKEYKIGDRGPGGGWVFYDKGNYTDGWRYMEAAPEDQGNAPWGCEGSSVPGTHTALGYGKVNTYAILRACNEQGIAARISAAYGGGGKSDWFLPSEDELYAIYANLHKVGVGGFAVEVYWSSSEFSASRAWNRYFANGGQDTFWKDFRWRVRAVRSF